jgi:hypothetical protein
MYMIEFMCGNKLCNTVSVARFDLVKKVVDKLLPNPMYTAVKIKHVTYNY